MKKIVKISIGIISAIVTLWLLASSASAQLSQVMSPTIDQAKTFFDWQINKAPIYGADGRLLEGFSEFRSSKGNTLHVGNSTYSPWQPQDVFNTATQALDLLGKPYSVRSVGSFDNDVNIFAQFDVGDSKFKLANGKEMGGYLTMAKGNDESLPVSFWLTMIMIVCANTFRAALAKRKGNASRVSRRQTKNSQLVNKDDTETPIERLVKQLLAVLTYRESVVETLNRMAATPITLDEGLRAYLGLVKRDATEKVDLSDTGKTHLRNGLDRFETAFKTGKGASTTDREGWFAGVTNLATHGNQESKKFNAEKQFLASEFKSGATRKELAFAMAQDDQSFAGLVASGEEIMSQLIGNRIHIASPTPSNQSTEFARLIGA